MNIDSLGCWFLVFRDSSGRGVKGLEGDVRLGGQDVGIWVL